MLEIAQEQYGQSLARYGALRKWTLLALTAAVVLYFTSIRPYVKLKQEEVRARAELQEAKRVAGELTEIDKRLLDFSAQVTAEVDAIGEQLVAMLVSRTRFANRVARAEPTADAEALYEKAVKEDVFRVKTPVAPRTRSTLQMGPVNMPDVPEETARAKVPEVVNEDVTFIRRSMRLGADRAVVSTVKEQIVPDVFTRMNEVWHERSKVLLESLAGIERELTDYETRDEVLPTVARIRESITGFDLKPPSGAGWLTTVNAKTEFVEELISTLKADVLAVLQPLRDLAHESRQKVSVAEADVLEKARRQDELQSTVEQLGSNLERLTFNIPLIHLDLERIAGLYPLIVALVYAVFLVWPYRLRVRIARLENALLETDRGQRDLLTGIPSYRWTAWGGSLLLITFGAVGTGYLGVDVLQLDPQRLVVSDALIKAYAAGSLVMLVGMYRLVLTHKLVDFVGP